ncbi:MAG: hypothetical protein HQL75_08115 [Magnetococcales bacterium]|nr:hypothetical protein [Magnetococcales bacterium]
MLSQVIMKSLFAYGLLMVIGFFVAVIIKVIVDFFNRAADAKAKAAPPVVAKSVARPAPAVSAGIPPHHIVAIIAATQSLMGGSILRIEDAGVDKSWTSVGRSIQQSSHDVRR